MFVGFGRACQKAAPADLKRSRAQSLSLGFLTLLYLTVPLVAPGWAVLGVVVLLFCGGHLTSAWPAERTRVGAGEILIVGAVSFALCGFAGIGGFAPQTYDWAKHNAVLMDCVKQSWPVILTDGHTQWPLVYYVAYYLPAALAGKITGYGGAQVALWIWSSLGVMLACFWFARLARLPARLAPLFFFAFSGLVVIPNLLVQLLGLADNNGWVGFYPNEFWARIWQFPSHYWMLEWAPGQALAGWLSAALFLGAAPGRRPLCFAYLLVCDLLWSPFVGVGLALVVFFLLCQQRDWARIRLSPPLLLLVLPAGLLGIFYAAKIAPGVAARFPKIPVCWFTQFQDAPNPAASVFLLLLFVVFAFGLLVAFVRAAFPPASGERKLAAACGLALACLLPVTVGYFSDLALRGCGVPLFLLAALTARAALAGGLAPMLRRWFWGILVLSAVTPLVEIGFQGYGILQGHVGPPVTPTATAALIHLPADGFNFLGAQYVGSTNSFYCQYLAR